MKKYRRKSIIVEACQWRKLGDIPEVRKFGSDGFGEVNNIPCPECGHSFLEHGEIYTIKGIYEMICPSDYVLKRIDGQFYILTWDEFELDYELIEEAEWK